MDALAVARLTVRYPQAPRPVLEDLAFRLPRGSLTLLLGSSGSGKSTLALTLVGLIPQHIPAQVTGQISVAGLDPRRAPPAQVAARVGVLFQDPEAGFATLTVEDELAFGLENLAVPREAMDARIQSALEAVGMASFRQRRLDTLSGGEAQRIALAALLAMAPPVLVLDEPTANLDPQATADFFATLARLKGQHTILLIEHKLDACWPLADQALFLGEKGRLLAAGPPEPTLRSHLDEVLRAGIWVPSFLEPRPRPRPAPEDFPPLQDEPPAVETRDLVFGYTKGRLILRGVSLRIPQGDFVALLGPNGAGKSTLAMQIAGLLPPPQQGSVRLFGQPVTALAPRQRADLVGFVFQNPEHQFVTDRVWDELAYSLRARGWPESRVRERVDALLQQFRLREHAQRNPFTLSQGQKRRLSVGTMLAAGQRLLILDEPTFGQDRNTAYALMEQLRTLNRQGVTIVMVTHDRRLSREYARRAVVLQAGRVVYDGLPPD